MQAANFVTATPRSATSACTTWRPARGRWSFCCTASLSSGTAGDCRSNRSRRPDSASSHPTCAATTCHRSRTGWRPTTPTGWSPTSAGSSRNAFDLPELPESVVHANHWHFFRHFLHDARPPYTTDEIERYVEAWSQPGAATGMINYYRSSVRQSQKKAEEALRPINAPTLVIWGQRDRFLGR